MIGKSPGRSLAEIVADLHGAGCRTMAHEVLKTAPKGFPKDHPRIELLPPQGHRHDEGLAGKGVARHRQSQGQGGEHFTGRPGPLNEWLARYVG